MSFDTQALEPFTARYSATLDLLIDLPVTATRTLSRSESGDWRFTSEADSLVARQFERSQLIRTEDGWQPLAYRFERSVLGREREIDIQFNQSNRRVTTVAEGEPWSQPWKPGVQDKLSYQLQLRSDLLAGRERLSYQIADGGQIKEYRFEKIGTERLSTEAGELETLVLELDRTGDEPLTRIWMAPELNYLTVRLLRTDEEGREHILTLKEFYQP